MSIDANNKAKCIAQIRWFNPLHPAAPPNEFIAVVSHISNAVVNVPLTTQITQIVDGLTQSPMLKDMLTMNKPAST